MLLRRNIPLKNRTVAALLLILVALWVVAWPVWFIVGRLSDALVSAGGALYVDGRRQVRVQWARDVRDRVRVMLVEDSESGVNHDEVFLQTRYPASRKDSGLWVRGKRVELGDQVILVANRGHADGGVEITTISRKQVEAIVNGNRELIEQILRNDKLPNDG